MDKKKRHTSGSRSKSHKSKPNQFSVDLKPNKIGHAHALYEQPSKTKTQSSLNKSKANSNSRKHPKSKKPISVKRTIKDHKNHTSMMQDVSHSISADRKHSLTKMNRTQANYFEPDEISRSILKLQKKLNKISKPRTIDPEEILKFYREIFNSIESAVGQELEPLLKTMHDLYVQPFYALYQYISPYADLIKKKEQLSIQVEGLMKNIEQYQQNLDPQGLQILRLRQKIAENAKVIEAKQAQEQALKSRANPNIKPVREREPDSEKRQQPRARIRQFEGEATESDEQEPPKSPEVQSTYVKNPASEGFGSKGLKINIEGIARGGGMQGFHDQFYSHLEEFSESWRNQAIRQKRF